MARQDAFHKFPDGFLWGAITSAYQIEGAWNEAGKSPSIWDTFTHTPGKIERNENADIAVDHYHRWPEDIALMRELGLQAYHFSISWPRVLPEGRGAPNPAGLDFYDRLVDGLLEAGIEPHVMLYHWDLPQILQDEGGWSNRLIAGCFADFATTVARRLGDRVSQWVTHNEPFVSSMAGYFTGEHAPGIQDISQAVAAAHHLLLSHGLAVQALRPVLPSQAKVGIILNLTPAYPASEGDEDRAAAARWDSVANRLFLDPLFRGAYPPGAIDMLSPWFPEIHPGDLETISTPIDFLGINYYSRAVLRSEPGFPILQAALVNQPDSEYSQMWEIYAPGMYDILTRVYREYQVQEIYVTENGVPVPDGIDFDGRVRDERRIRYLRDHLSEVHRAIEAGVPVRGYFHWTLMDNFEWAYGYRMRFGLIYVDYDTLKRTIKDSGRWYAEVIKNNGIRLAR